MYPEVEVVIKSGATEDLMDLAKSDEIDLIFTLDKKIYSSQWTCVAERIEDIVFVTANRNWQSEESTARSQNSPGKHFF